MFRLEARTLGNNPGVGRLVYLPLRWSSRIYDCCATRKERAFLTGILAAGALRYPCQAACRSSLRHQAARSLKRLRYQNW